MDINEKKLEGEQMDNLEGTSPSGEDGVELNSSPVPTAEEKEDAGMVGNAELDNPPLNEGIDNIEAVEEPEKDLTVQSDTPVVTETVEESVVTDEQPEIPGVSEERIFTQSQVNDLVGKTRMETREQTYRAIYGRYGVEDESGGSSAGSSFG